MKLNKKRPYFSTVHVTVEEGSTNAAWEELWRLILSNTISESRLKEEEPPRERPTDGV